MWAGISKQRNRLFYHFDLFAVWQSAAPFTLFGRIKCRSCFSRAACDQNSVLLDWWTQEGDRFILREFTRSSEWCFLMVNLIRCRVTPQTYWQIPVVCESVDVLVGVVHLALSSPVSLSWVLCGCSQLRHFFTQMCRFARWFVWTKGIFPGCLCFVNDAKNFLCPLFHFASVWRAKLEPFFLFPAGQWQ